MKFCVENDLSLFEFHDSTFSFVSYDGVDLVVSAAMVNVHKNTPQNPSDHDMEIASARITFRNLQSVTYEPGVLWKTGEDGKSYPVGPQVILRGENAIRCILEALQDRIRVYHFEKAECGYCIGGCGIEPYFEIKLDFDGVSVSWDEYKKKAWYELHRQYRYDAALQTQKGEQAVKLTVICHEEPVYHKGSLQQPPTVNVGCTFGGKEYWGHGIDLSGVDALEDLQRQLPEGVFLKCEFTGL